MPNPALPVQVLEDALDGFARDNLVQGGSLRHKAYLAWNSTVPTVNATSVTRQLGYVGHEAWGLMIHDRRRRLASHASEPDVLVAELPVRCRGRNRVVWRSSSIEDWPDLSCGCTFCGDPTIADTYPHLTSLLVDQTNADSSVNLWVFWRCPRGRQGHRDQGATAVARAGQSCSGCRSEDLFYSTHSPGDLTAEARDKPSSAFESRVHSALGQLLPDHALRAQCGVVVPQDELYYHGYALTPDLVIADLRVVIELDGGDGASPNYSQHDTPEGATEDQRRDLLYTTLGWQPIRVRHPNALPLPQSPAIVLTTSSQSPKVIATLIAEAVQAIGTTRASARLDLAPPG